MEVEKVLLAQTKYGPLQYEPRPVYPHPTLERVVPVKVANDHLGNWKRDEVHVWDGVSSEIDCGCLGHTGKCCEDGQTGIVKLLKNPQRIVRPGVKSRCPQVLIGLARSTMRPDVRGVPVASTSNTWDVSGCSGPPLYGSATEADGVLERIRSAMSLLKDVVNVRRAARKLMADAQCRLERPSAWMCKVSGMA